MSSLIRPLIAVLTMLVALAAPLSAPAASSDGPSQREQQDALRIAEADPRVQTHLALRPDLTTDVIAAPTSSTLDEVFRGDVGQLIVRYLDGDEVRMSVAVDRTTRSVTAINGQQLIVMPDVTSLLHKKVATPATLLPFLVAFLATIFVAWRRSWLLAIPLAIIAIAFTLMLLGVVSASHVRSGNIALYGIITLMLVWWAFAALADARRRAAAAVRRFNVPGPTALWLTIAAAALGFQAWIASTVPVPIDVAYASDAGARLMKGGVVVYGNTVDIPAFLSRPDTYGPVAYLAYVPGVALFETVPAAILGTNVVLSVITTILALLIGRRAGGMRVGAWAAAAWATCPFVSVGVVSGNNDVVIAALLAVTMLTIHRPAWRAASLAAAAAVKFLPLAAAFAVLRHRGEQRRADVVALASGIVTLLVVFAIGLRGFDGIGPFRERALEMQLGRDDIASFWGLAGWSELRYVVLVAGIAVGVWSLRLVRTHGATMVPACVTAVLALLLAGLPQLWPTYASWLLPLTIAQLVGVNASALRADDARDLVGAQVD